jgi:hypothetical protein
VVAHLIGTMAVVAPIAVAVVSLYSEASVNLIAAKNSTKTTRVTHQVSGTSFFGKYYALATPRMQEYIRVQVAEPFIDVPEPTTIQQAIDAVDISQINMYPWLPPDRKMKEVIAAFKDYAPETLVWELFEEPEVDVEIAEIVVEAPKPVYRASAAASIVPPGMPVPQLSVVEDKAEEKPVEVPVRNVPVLSVPGTGALKPPTPSVAPNGSPSVPAAKVVPDAPRSAPEVPSGSGINQVACTCKPAVLFGKTTHAVTCAIRKV